MGSKLNNPNFKGVEFGRFRKEAGLNSFNLTPKKWIDTTDALVLDKKSRLKILIQTANEQRATLDNIDFLKSIKKESDTTYIDVQKPQQLSSLNQNLKKGLDYNPNKNKDKESN